MSQKAQDVELHTEVVEEKVHFALSGDGVVLDLPTQAIHKENIITDKHVLL